MLDSLPGAPAKAGAPTADEQPHSSKEPEQEESPRGQPARHSLLNDGALLASLPLALRASVMGEHLAAADNAPSLPTPAMKGPRSEDSGSSLVAGAKAATVGRLIGERAFHLGASPSSGVIASRTLAIDAPFAPGAASAVGANLEAMPARPFADDVPSDDNAPAPAPIAPRAVTPATNRAGLTRAAAHEAARSGRKPEVSAPPPVARVASSAPTGAPAEPSGKAAGDHLPDPSASAAPSAAQTGPFGAQLSTPFVAGAAFGPDSSTMITADVDIASRASALGPGPAPSAPPVKEIDVDLSPGGLEDVSMTMRLAGDRLSVVIRAASSQTLGSIEGARDAIADRLAAIGQPLDSLIVKQSGVNTDGNANGNTSSADGGSAGGEQRSAQGAGERGGSDDASLSRRGAGRDRSF